MRWLRTDTALAIVLTVYSLLIAAAIVLAVVAYVGVTSTADTARLAAADARAASAKVTRLATGSNRALCALRGDLEDRVRQTDKFLAKHPEGFAGIPAATLRTNANGQRRTIRALSNLKCPERPHKRR
jgi:hypothetical protein